ncbi:MAG: spheroidene monooxygenase [Pseudomonadota bacterium]
MQTVTVSLFRFEGVAAKLWAFSQMGFARPALAKTPALQFFKMMGTGAGAGFSTKPNFGVYTIMCLWPSEDVAREQLQHSKVLGRYRAKASETATVFLRPTSCRGAWDGAPPFQIQPGVEQALPVVAMTRATLKKRHLRRFWSLVPAISDRAEFDEKRHFMIGMGEVPWLHQVTFSFWETQEAMKAFSIDSDTHGVAVKRAYTEGWFSEYMFARFNLLSIEGNWRDIPSALINQSR